MTCDPPRICDPVCEDVFEQIRCYPMITGSTRVTWALKSTFLAPAPHTFLLQYSQYPVDDDTAWEDIGMATEDTYEAIDVKQRNHGNYMRTHYRVVVTDGDSRQYVSRPIQAWANFDFRQQTLVQQVLRTEQLRMQGSPNSMRGMLLKRKTSGQHCTECIDPLTKRVTESCCETCYGTGFVGGYWRSTECSMVDFVKPAPQRSFVKEPQGTVESQVKTVRMLNIPQIFTNDVWICQSNDHRYVIQTFQSEVEIASAAIVLFPVEFRLAEFSHIIYKFPVD